MFTVCFVYSFCDEGWKGSENKIFYIYIYIFSMVNFYFIRSRKE